MNQNQDVNNDGSGFLSSGAAAAGSAGGPGSDAPEGANVSNVPLIAGVAGGVALLALVAAIVVARRRRGRTAAPSAPDNTIANPVYGEGPVNPVTASAWDPDKYEVAAPENIYEEAHDVSLDKGYLSVGGENVYEAYKPVGGEDHYEAPVPVSDSGYHNSAVSTAARSSQALSYQTIEEEESAAAANARYDTVESESVYDAADRHDVPAGEALYHAASNKRYDEATPHAVLYDTAAPVAPVLYDTAERAAPGTADMAEGQALYDTAEPHAGERRETQWASSEFDV